MKPAAAASDVQRQLDSLRLQIGELKTLLQKSLSTQAPANSGAGKAMGAGGSSMAMDRGEMGKAPAGMNMTGGMGMMEKRPMEPMRKKEMMGMAPKDSMPKMDMHSEHMGMSEMKMKAGMKSAADTGMAMNAGMTTPASASTPSSLAGNPGGSHLYHIGATGFFLDQPSVDLTTEQRASLNRIS